MNTLKNFLQKLPLDARLSLPLSFLMRVGENYKVTTFICMLNKSFRYVHGRLWAISSPGRQSKLRGVLVQAAAKLVTEGIGINQAKK